MMEIFTVEQITVLRKCLHLSVEQLWSYLDMTKQSGYNIEKGRIRMSRTIAIAMTTVLKYLCEEQKLDYKALLNSYEEVKGNQVFLTIFEQV